MRTASSTATWREKGAKTNDTIRYVGFFPLCLSVLNRQVGEKRGLFRPTRHPLIRWCVCVCVTLFVAWIGLKQGGHSGLDCVSAARRGLLASSYRTARRLTYSEKTIVLIKF